MIIDPLTKRELHSCFSLVIPLNDESAIADLIHQGMILERYVNSVIEGSMSFEDVIEASEEFVVDIDSYVAEVERNLDQTLIKIKRW